MALKTELIKAFEALDDLKEQERIDNLVKDLKGRDIKDSLADYWYAFWLIPLAFQEIHEIKKNRKNKLLKSIANKCLDYINARIVKTPRQRMRK